MILSKSVDWDTWILHIKHKTIIMEIWDLINPKITVKSICLQRPRQPSLDLVRTEPNPAIKVILLDDYKIEKK